MYRILLAVAAAALIPASASAAPFELRYTGSLNAADTLALTSGGPDLLTAVTPFSISAVFDTSSPDLSAPIPLPGWVSYAPERATITVGSTAYTLVGYNEDPVLGVTVNVFDPTNVFTPGLYGVGLFNSPVEDGAGIVGDFSSASPAVLVDNLQPAVFGGYNGAGFSAGAGCFPLGNPACQVQPWQLRDAVGNAYALTLSGRTEQAADGAPLHTAQLVAVPEPASLALLGIGMFATAAVRRRRA